MTPAQLAAARATHWRQDAQPLLTLDAATTWLERMQLVLYLPRKSHVLAPAPSFVEAVAGAGHATPPADAIAQAHALLVRMVAEGTVVPLNLFGTPGEQPDFLIATQALPHAAALQGDRNWKKPPSRAGAGKVSPLAIEIWKLLAETGGREGALTAGEIRGQLGHELTEAAILRGLSELWHNLRVAPLPAGGGEPSAWQILSVTHKKEMAAAGTMPQTAALSMLVANYLQSVVTATAEDVEAFLSPFASRSRLRDVVRGLTATRQLRALSMDAQTFLFIENTLPEMPEIAASAETAEARPAFMGRSAYRERMLNKGKEEKEETPGEEAGHAPRRAPYRPSSGRPSFERPGPGRPAPGRRFAANGGGASSFRKTSASREGDRRPSGPPRRAFGPKPPFGSKPYGTKPSGAAKQAGEGRPPFRRTAGPAGDRPPSSGRPRPERSSAGRPFSPRPGAGRPPFDRKLGGPSKSGEDRASSSRPFAPRPFTPRVSGDRVRPSFKPRSGSGPGFAKPGSSGSGGSGKERGRPSFGTRGAGRSPNFSSGDRPSRPRPTLDASSDAASRNSNRAGFQSRTGGRPSAPRPPRADGGRPFTPRARPGSTGGDSRLPRREGGYPSNPNRPSRAPRAAGSFVKRDGLSGRPGSSRPSSGRSASSRSAGSRPPARGGKPGFSGRPGVGAGGTGRPSGPRPGGRPGARSGGPKSGSKPGGMRPPTRKPRPEPDGV